MRGPRASRPRAFRNPLRAGRPRTPSRRHWANAQRLIFSQPRSEVRQFASTWVRLSRPTRWASTASADWGALPRIVGQLFGDGIVWPADHDVGPVLSRLVRRQLAESHHQQVVADLREVSCRAVEQDFA